MRPIASYVAIALMACACGAEDWSFDRGAALADSEINDVGPSFNESPGRPDAAEDGAEDAIEDESASQVRDADNATDASTACATDGACAAEPPQCSEAGGSCAHCGTDNDCADASGGPTCDISTGRCVGCTSDSQCRVAMLRRCEPSTQACVQCLSNADCAVDAVCDFATRACKHV